MSTTDANGIVFLEETDTIAPFHTRINGLQAATSTALRNARRGPLFAPNIAARNALLVTYGSSATEPLWVDVAGVLWRHNGSAWTQPLAPRPTISFHSGSSPWVGTWPGDGTAVNTKFIRQTIAPSGTGDFIIMTPSEYSGGGILHADVASAQGFDLTFGYQMSSGNLTLRGYNTSGTVVTNPYAITGAVYYWKP